MRAGKRMIDPEKDFRVVCSNCHRMLHKGGRLLDVQELKKIIELAG
jgi:predicted HNH restriction endonuclease